MIPLKSICTILLFPVFSTVYAQSIEANQFKGMFAQSLKKEEFKAAKETHNEVQFVFAGMYLFYKHFVSSQDHASCVFYPSCSTYAMESISEKGLITGVMNAFDRLSRCHLLSAHHYAIHEETHLLYDPVHKK